MACWSASVIPPLPLPLPLPPLLCFSLLVVDSGASASVSSHSQSPFFLTASRATTPINQPSLKQTRRISETPSKMARFQLTPNTPRAGINVATELHSTKWKKKQGKSNGAKENSWLALRRDQRWRGPRARDWPALRSGRRGEGGASSREDLLLLLLLGVASTTCCATWPGWTHRAVSVTSNL